MKNVSKVFALLLAVIMVLAMVAPVFAANENPHTITLTFEKPDHSWNNYKNVPLSMEKIKAYFSV